MKNKKKVIIVGGGTAGLIIANRLQNYFNVSVIEKSKYKKYPLLFKIPLLIGLLIRKKGSNYVSKREFKLSNGRLIPFHESNLWGGASVMNGAVHVFGFKKKWKHLLDKFHLTYEDLYESNERLYSFDLKEKNKITLMKATQNKIDLSFLETLSHQKIEQDDMSHSEKEACGPIQNTVRKYFRTSVLSTIKNQIFKSNLDEKVEKVLFNEKGEVIGVQTDKETRHADFVILCAGVIGSNSLLLRQKENDQNSIFRNLPIGEKVKDHSNLRINVLSKGPIGSLNEIYSSWYKKLFLGIKHFLGISTVMRGTGATSGAYLDLDKDGEIDTRIQILQFSETGRHASKGSLFSTSDPSFSISINAIHPESSGSIHLEGENTIVDPSFLSARKDIDILKLALTYCVQLLKSRPISDNILRIEEEEFMLKEPENYIRDNIYSGHHLIGGLQDAIDDSFKVKNTEGLYVCDASVFDYFIASNIHSTVVLLSDMFAKKFIAKNLENDPVST